MTDKRMAGVRAQRPDFSGTNVFHLEDDDQSAMGLAVKSRMHGIGLERQIDIAEARPVLRERAFPVLVIDLEVFDSGKRRLGAGAELAREIVVGSLGPANQGSAIIIHTAHLGVFEASGLSEYSQIELCRKPSPAFVAVQQALLVGAGDPLVLEVRPMHASEAADLGIEAHVLGWLDYEVVVPLTMFDASDLVALSVATDHLYFSALGNLAASSPGELALTGIQLILDQDEEIRDLWTDS